MNRVIMIGEPAPEQQLKPVEFVMVISHYGFFNNPTKKPSDYKFIECQSINYHNGLDLFFCHNGDRNNIKEPCLFLGHLNDGVY